MHLGSHTSKSYDDQLDQLMAYIQQMGTEVKELVLLAKASLRDRNPKRVEEALVRDAHINALDHRLEQAATTILALQQPMAIDLRFVTSAIKSAGTLERAGDLAKNTVKRSVKINEDIPEPLLIIMEQMADHVVEMMNGAMEAVSVRDTGIATRVWKQDDAVDDLYHDFFTQIQQLMTQHPERIPAGTHLIFMAKNFERIADYATNLAKTVYYVANGVPADKSVLKS